MTRRDGSPPRQATPPRHETATRDTTSARGTASTRGTTSARGVTPPRNTRQRAAVAELLAGTDGFHSAQELHAMLRSRGQRVGLTTVYRTLQALAEAGEVDVMRPAGGEMLYRRCSRGHHHHLVCRACGRTVEVAGPAVESWAERVAAEHGYVDVSHTLEVFGTCVSCA